MLKFVIVIQARSTSTRLPNKCFLMLGDKPIIEHVLDTCHGSANYTNKYSNTTGVFVDVYLAVPLHDKLAIHYKGKENLYEGSEHDVLSRYLSVADLTNADYIVRITADCPLLPEYIITKYMKIASKTKFDYISNVDPRFRTAPDGHDCEVISRRLLEYIGKSATTDYEKEHVTSYARDTYISWAKIKHMHGHLDLSHLKISVDTLEDLEFVREQYKKVEQKKFLARKEYGYDNVNSF